MLTLRMKRFIRRTGRNNFDVKRGDKAGFDKSKVRCYKCNELGHFARECKGGTTNHQNTGSGSSQAPRFNNRGSNSNPSSSQALVSQEGQGFDWSDHAEEAVQNQALVAEIKESEIPTEVSSKLCSDSCLETVKKYRDHNQTMSDSIKKMERERREYVKVIDNLEDQIKAYKANELQFEYDHNYWKWEKKKLERKLSKEKEELESARKELSKAKEDLDKFSKSSKALESIIRAQVTDDLKRGIGYNSTPPPYNQNYIPPTTDLLESLDRSGMKEGLDRIDPVDSEEESDKKRTSETIPDENHLLTNEKGGMPFIPSKKIETTRKDKGKSVMTSEKSKERKTETTRKNSRKDHYTQRTIVDPGTSSQSQNKNHPRGNKRNWNNHWAQCHGIDLSKINRPKPCFICCKTNHLARDCYFNPFNQRNSFQARRFVPTHKMVVPKQNRSSQPKRKVQKKRVEKKSVKLVTKWVPKASLSNTTASISSGNNSVASDSSGNSLNSSNQGRRSSLWHVDSGCSRNMTGIILKVDMLPLGIIQLEVKQKPDGIFINQSKYVASMLQKFGMNDAKPASTPMETHKHLTADVEGEEVDVHHYRSMIGSLMYLTASRPDIMFVVCVCARYQVRPKESHLHAVKRIFKYLKGQPRLGLWYPNDSSFDLVAYTDSDYGGANLDRNSTSGGCQFLGGRLVSWQCKKQTTVSQSTTEAEYIGASQCCSQVLWIQNQMQDYGLSFLQTPIYIDNNSAISIVNNSVKHSKTKHIEIKYHFIRDCNEKKLIQVLKVHTDDQYADLFTKAFDVGRFTFLVTGVGMMNSE
ncbi:hypothetical protein OSB04_025433 [Centaurea solstitialis]|uniref:CCHC-type domain-containing protein n=1 Tax=Centaurea solstitialis TaxID=347529 RepID=A0AA38SZP4_9ASTR|nr:hypothetical protein OSB04_025433 [Centaurea solstitialis]